MSGFSRTCLVRLKPDTTSSPARPTFIRAQLSGNSRFDCYARGERTLLPLEEQNRLRLFRGRGMCTVCHEGPTVTDEQLHNTGVAWSSGPLPASGGHFLDEVLDFYGRGGRANPFLDRDLQPLGLSDEDKRALVSFLKTLSGEAASDTR